jgi:hypothetical protein
MSTGGTDVKVWVGFRTWAVGFKSFLNRKAHRPCLLQPNAGGVFPN